jgi:hypothetical protein
MEVGNEKVGTQPKMLGQGVELLVLGLIASADERGTSARRSNEESTKCRSHPK